jgi:beta-lactamase class A
VKATALLGGAVIATIVAGPLAAAQATQEAGTKEAVLWSQLHERVQAVERRLDGVLGVTVRDLEGGRTLELRADEVFPQASSIKWAVLYELYRQAGEGRVDLGEVRRLPVPRTGGGGVLELLGDGVSLTWRDLAILMMSHSDNEATNLLIDRVGMEAVNLRLAGLGLRATALRRRMMDLEAARRGDENVSTPAEMLRLVVAIRAGTGLPPEAAKDLMAVASVPKDSEFRRPIPASVPVADKPGALEGVRCVTAVVELPGRPYAAAIMTTYLKRDADGDAAIEEISKALFETFDRLARSSPLGRVISER